jgi:pyruvate dehydrogenase E1 component
MVERQENVFYYITLLNENYAMPGLKPGTEEQIIKGMYLLEEGAKKTPRVQAAGLGHHPARVDGRQGAAGSRLGRGRRRLELPELQRTGPRRPGRERWNLLHPTETPKVPFVTEQLAATPAR